MPKLLVSDYDNTLCTLKSSISLNVDTIKKFRDSGHKFVIATGRCFNSIKQMTDTYKIPYDYLICNDGSIIFDSNGKILHVNYLKNYEISNVLEYLRFKKQYFEEVHLYNENDRTNNFNNIIEIEAILKSLKDVKQVIHNINSSLNNIEVHRSKKHIFIKNHANKSTAIKELIEIINMNKEDVYTVGDNTNDIEMVRDYNGYNMLFSTPALYKNSKGTVLSVKQLIKKINK